MPASITTPGDGPATIAIKDGKLTFSLDHSPGAVGEMTPWQQDTFKVHWSLEDAFLPLPWHPTAPSSTSP